MLQKLNIEPSLLKENGGIVKALETLKQDVESGTVSQLDLVNLVTAYKVYKNDNDPIEKFVKVVSTYINPEEVKTVDSVRQYHQGQQVEFELDVEEKNVADIVDITKDAFVQFMIDNDIDFFHKDVVTKINHLTDIGLTNIVEYINRLIDGSSSPVTPRAQNVVAKLSDPKITDFYNKHIVLTKVTKVKIK
jgi:hypothetical protein